MHKWHIQNEHKKEVGKLFHRRLSLSEKKVAEKAHQQRESYFHSLIDSIMDVVSVLNEDGTFHFVSPSMEHVLGYTPTTLLGQNAFDFIHPDDRERILSIFDEAMQQIGTVRVCEFRFKHKDGSWRVLESQGKSILDEKGQPAGVIVSRDMTERKMAGDMLAESERRLSEILKKIELLAVMVDIYGNIVFCNDCFLRLTGWQHDEIIGKNWFDVFIPAEKRDSLKKLFREVMLTSHLPAHWRDEILTKNGDRRLISWNNIFFRDIEGKSIGMTSLGDDMTDRKKMEAEFLQAQKMEAVGRLASGVVHDFNNILTVIAGYAELLKLGLSGHKSKLTDLEELQKAVEHGKNLTHQLSLFSRKEKHPSPVLVDLNQAVHNMEGMLKQLIPEHIELKVHTSDSALQISMDAGQLEQVFTNMIVNARDAMPHGGEITIEVKNVERVKNGGRYLMDLASGKYALLIISDNGCGMDEKTKARIFEPFFTTKEKGKGTGLGLATSYGIIKQAGGDIQVETKLGAGSVFTIFLPIIERDP